MIAMTLARNIKFRALVFYSGSIAYRKPKAKGFETLPYILLRISDFGPRIRYRSTGLPLRYSFRLRIPTSLSLNGTSAALQLPTSHPTQQPSTNWIYEKKVLHMKKILNTLAAEIKKRNGKRKK
jgi:hypothetical protein